MRGTTSKGRVGRRVEQRKGEERGRTNEGKDRD